MSEIIARTLLAIFVLTLLGLLIIVSVGDRLPGHIEEGEIIFLMLVDVMFLIGTLIFLFH